MYAWIILGPAAVLLTLYFIAPLAYFLRYSVRPPSRSGFAGAGFTMGNFSTFLGDDYEVAALIRSVVIAVVATVITLLLALPVANLMRASRPWLKGVLVILAVFPLLTGSVIRTIGWEAILGYSGVLNSALTKLHLVREPLDILRTPYTVTLVIVSIVLSFMILLVHASLEQVDRNTERAAQSLGAGPFRTFWEVTFPQILPGVVAGTSLCFMLSVNAYATPLLIGAGQVPMTAPQIYQIVTGQGNFPLGAAMSVVVIAVSFGIVIVYGWLVGRQFEAWRRAVA
jgi:putative spermidine/putrescine transport system permease protein